MENTLHDLPEKLCLSPEDAIPLIREYFRMTEYSHLEIAQRFGFRTKQAMAQYYSMQTGQMLSDFVGSVQRRKIPNKFLIAQLFLAETNLPYEDVAERSGFVNVQSLRGGFKATLRITAELYREQFQKDEVLSLGEP